MQQPVAQVCRWLHMQQGEGMQRLLLVLLVLVGLVML
jgi:hypothetical protein